MWTRRVKTKTTQTYIHVLVTIAHKKKDSASRMKEIETEKEHSRLNKNWMEKISTGFICDMWTVFWVTAVCKRESVRVNRTTVHRDTIRHFVALVFIAAMKKLCEQQWKKNAYTHIESERRGRVFITFFFFTSIECAYIVIRWFLFCVAQIHSRHRRRRRRKTITTNRTQKECILI